MKSVRQTLVAFAAASLLFSIPAFAKCPVSEGATVKVSAPIGNLQVETNGRDAVEVEVNSKDIDVREICGKDRVEYTAVAPGQIRSSIDWKIVVPRNVNLDLVTNGGSIRMGDSDGWATLRTSGGSVTVGNIKGRTAIITQGGFIKAGNIGESAELRSSSAGSIEVANIGGNADLHTAGGSITTGVVNGKVKADSAGGTIYIKGARDEVIVTADSNIFIGDALRINAKSVGGNITNPKVRGPAKAVTDSGDIRLESAGGWVEASTGFGSIYVKLNPVNLGDDLHVTLQSGVGDVSIYIPERLKGVIEATIERPAVNGARRIISDFPMNGFDPPVAQTLTSGGNRGRGIVAPRGNAFMGPDSQRALINGGGNAIKLHTSLGKIEIFKIKL
jgi:hypothetical protein